MKEITQSAERDVRAIETGSDSRAKTINEKLTYILDAVKHVGWDLGECMFYMFENPKNRQETRTPRIASVVSKFVGGDLKYTVADIVDCWLNSSDGGVHY
jgi:hypothetical protein